MINFDVNFVFCVVRRCSNATFARTRASHAATAGKNTAAAALTVFSGVDDGVDRRRRNSAAQGSRAV
jgi:hypothetical protein